MTIKALTAVAIVTAALSSPVFAQDQSGPKRPVHPFRHYRMTHNEMMTPQYTAPGASSAAIGGYFDNDSFDRSRIGDHDSDFNPSPN